MQLRLGLLESLAAFPVLFVPCFISALKLIDLCHPLYRLRLFRGWIFLLPALPLFANATYVFLCLLKLVYACSNFHIALRGSTIHWPSPGHQRCWASSNTLRNSLRRSRDRQACYKLPLVAQPDYRRLAGVQLPAAPRTLFLRPALEELPLG